jgi:hypothetical protein
MLNDHRRHADDAVLDEPVSSLLSAAAAPCEPGELPGEAAALAAFRASRTPTRRKSMLTSLTTAKAGVAAAIGSSLLVTGGVAAAATGTLPGAAQDTARGMLETIGVEVPGADEAAGPNPGSRGGSAVEVDDATKDPAEVTDGAAGKGEAVSELATTTDVTGADKGAAISELASDGKSQAGEQEQDRSGTARDRADQWGQSAEEHGEQADVAPKGQQPAEQPAGQPADKPAEQAAQQPAGQADGAGSGDAGESNRAEGTERRP